MPELARQVALGVVDTLIAEADYPAVLKADGVRYEEVFGETMAVPDGASMFEIIIDRSGFPPVDIEPELVIRNST